MCSRCIKECNKIRPYLCAADVLMNVTRFAQILHVQDMHENPKTLQASCTPNTVSSYLHSLLPVNEMTTGETSTHIPCDINVKCSGMLRPVERRPVTDIKPSLSRSRRQVLECSETSTICQYKRFNNHEDL